MLLNQNAIGRCLDQIAIIGSFAWCSFFLALDRNQLRAGGEVDKKLGY
jgi:hypothetical protein